MAAMLTIAQMADFFGISERTFANIRQRQPEIDAAYKEGRADVIGKVAASLIQDALDGDTTSRIFFLKTQAGWRETSHVEVTGKDSGPIQTQEVSALERITGRIAGIAARSRPDEDTGGTERI